MAQGNDLKFQNRPATESASKDGNDRTHEREHAGDTTAADAKTLDFLRFRSFQQAQAFAAANLWGNPEHSDSAVELLVQLIPKADAKTARAILDSFRIVDELRPDGPTTKLLQSIVDHPNVIGLAGSSFLVERLETLLPHEAELVA